MDPASILWSDSSCYDARFEKSAAALAAGGQALVENPIAKAVGFSLLFESVAEAVAEHFTTRWNDPSAYYWVRRTVQFLAALHGAPMGRIETAYCAEVGLNGPEQALRFHLSDFKRFAVALAIISKSELAFGESYLTARPLALPGTDLVISGDGEISIRGVHAKYIDAIAGPKPLFLPIAVDASSS